MMHIHIKHWGFYRYDIITKKFYLVFPINKPRIINKYSYILVLPAKPDQYKCYNYQSFKDMGWITYLSKRDFETEIYRWKAERV